MTDAQITFVVGFLFFIALGFLNKHMRKKGKTGAKAAAGKPTDGWSEEGWDWETFILWQGHGDGICWQCSKNNHTACHQPECQCKDEVCIRSRALIH
ncbi:MAG: hypothetical protein WA213_16385 [Terriglobales bacterium]